MRLRHEKANNNATFSQHHPKFDEALFQKSLIKLAEYEESLFKARSVYLLDGGLHFKKPEVHFCFKKRSSDSFDASSQVGVRRLRHRKINTSATSRKALAHVFGNCYRAVGTQASPSYVTYRLPGGDLIKIRMFQASSYGENEVAWDTYRLHQVSYVIGMTFAGPIAYDIQTYQPSTINKLQGSAD